MTKNLNLKIQYTIFAFLLWAGIFQSVQAQNLSLDHRVDTNCILVVSLLDSNQIIASFNPPYNFSIGGISVSNNSLGSAAIDISSLTNGNYNLNVIDGNQNYYLANISITCGQNNVLPSFSLIDSFYQNPLPCNQCNGAGEIRVINPVGALYTFEWSDGLVATDSISSQRTDLCTGIYTVVVTDTFGNKNAASISISCNNAPTPQVATCFPSLTRYLGTNNEVIINSNDLSAIGIDSNQTRGYIVDATGAISGHIRFDCNDLGYHNLTLLLIDTIQQLSDTCNLLVNIQDSLGTCNGVSANTNGVLGTTTNASNCNTCDATYSFTGFLDSLTAFTPATFAWSDGSTSGSRTDLCPNQNYNLSVSDINGTIHTTTVNLSCLGNTCIDSNQVDSSFSCPQVYAPVCGCDNITYMNACVAAYTYGVSTWTQGACNSSGLSLNISTNPSPACPVSSCTGSASIFVSGGLGPYTVTWSDTTITGFSPTNICSGNYTITVTDLSSGNAVSSVVRIGISGCVWPGDTDDNTVANNFDLLPIGLTYGNTGPSRPQASSIWFPFQATDWNSTPNLGLPNQKHFDADGNGTIDSLDVDVISQNYGRSYYRSGIQSLPGISPLGVNDISVYTGDSITTPIYLGDSNYPVTNAYGLAFTINYNPDHIEAGSISASFNNSWLGNDLIHIQKVFDRTGQIEVAVSRKDKFPVSGYGPIGTLNFTIKDDLIMGRLLITDSIISSVTISDVRVINHQNVEIGTTPITGSITILELLSIDAPNKDQLDIRLFPNPTDGLLNIISKKASITSIQLFNATGQLIHSNKNPNSYNNKISMDRLATGIYFLSVQTDQGVFNQKVQVIH